MSRWWRFGALGLPLAPLPDSLIGPMAKRISHAALALGYEWKKLDKMIYTDQCRTGCWRCVYGCPFGAKWTARNFIDDALAAGAELQTEARASRILTEHGRAVGVEYRQHGEVKQVFAANVVLAGGGIGSPQLLQASGLRTAIATHFSDPVIAVMGSVDDLESHAEVPMAGGMHLDHEGIMLADLTLPRPMYQAFALQVGRIDRMFSHKRTLTIMVKIRDQLGGNIGPRWVNKSLQVADKKAFSRGVEIGLEILQQAGASHIFKSWHFAAHPGGSVRIGDGVDSNLRTTTGQLYVCDASVIPGAWGLPPSLTLMCLGKRLADHLDSH